jgi:hypothetical protein
LCKDNKEHTQKIADILAQLLQAEDNAELSVVHNSLMTLFKSDAKGKKYVGINNSLYSGIKKCFLMCMLFTR